MFELNKFIRTVKNYFSDPSTNIFKNYIDALLGGVILLLLPGISLFSTINILDEVSIQNYVFPLISICLAGAYDTYGRYEYKSPKNIKLVIRLVLDIISIFVSLFAVVTENTFLIILAPTLLIIPGLMICYEIYIRVKTAIMISKWYAI